MKEATAAVVLSVSSSCKVLTQAYQHPRVNSSIKKFTWHLPDEAELHKFCFQFLGWDDEQSTKLIEPIVKKLKEGGRMKQRRIDDYFLKYGDDERFARFRSKRLRAAVEVIILVLYTRFAHAHVWCSPLRQFDKH